MSDMGQTSGNAAKAALAIIILTIMGSALGLIRESVLAAYFGASAISDAYKIAFTIPYILTALINAAMNTTFIPVYTEFLKKKTAEQIRHFVNNVFNTTAAITVAVTIAAMPFASFFVNLTAPGFKAEAFGLAVRLTVIMLPSVIFLTLGNLSTGYLHSNNRFAAAALTGIPFNLIIIGSVFIPSSNSVELLAAGSLLGIASQLFIQVPSVISAGYRPKPAFLDFKEEGLRRILALSIPTVIGSMFNHLSSVVDRILASGLDEGSISSLDYAGRVTGNINGIFILSIITVTFPNLARMFDDTEGFRATVLKIMRIIIFVSAPAVTGVFILRVPIVRLLFERGQFNDQDTAMTSVVLGCLTLGLLCSGIEALLVKAFYALKDTKTPVVNGIIGVCINIALSFVLVRVWRLGGVALAASLSIMIKSGLLFCRFRLKVGFSYGRNIALLCLKALAGSAAMGGVVHILSSLYYGKVPGAHSFLGNAAGLAINIGAGCMVYAVLMYVLKTEEIKLFAQLMRRRTG